MNNESIRSKIENIEKYIVEHLKIRVKNTRLDKEVENENNNTSTDNFCTTPCNIVFVENENNNTSTDNIKKTNSVGENNQDAERKTNEEESNKNKLEESIRSKIENIEKYIVEHLKKRVKNTWISIGVFSLVLVFLWALMLKFENIPFWNNGKNLKIILVDPNFMPLLIGLTIMIGFILFYLICIRLRKTHQLISVAVIRFNTIKAKLDIDENINKNDIQRELSSIMATLCEMLDKNINWNIV